MSTFNIDIINQQNALAKQITELRERRDRLDEAIFEKEDQLAKLKKAFASDQKRVNKLVAQMKKAGLNDDAIQVALKVDYGLKRKRNNQTTSA